MREEKIIPCKDQTTALSLDTISRKKQALIFCSSKRAAESQAEKIAKAQAKQHKEELQTLSKQILSALSSPTKQCQRLALCVEQGVAFHHAGLTSAQREVLEDGFREGTISVICSTPTLAAGLDLPAFRAIIRDTKRFGQRGMTSIPVLEYEQMAGRAGRPGKEDYGEAIIIAAKEQNVEEYVEEYIHGEVEDIYSKLAVEPVLRTYILSLIATELITNRKELLDFFDKTFYAHQFGDIDKLHASIDRMTLALQKWNCIEGNEQEDEEQEQGFRSALEYVQKKKQHKERELKATTLGKRISEMYLDPLTANQLLEGLEQLHKKPQDKTNAKQTFALIHLLCCSLEMRPLLRTRVADVERVEQHKEQEKPFIDEEQFYEISQDNYDDTIKTTLFLLDWVNENSEEQLLETYDVRPGEISAKLGRIDWLCYACEELARIQGYQHIIKILRHIRARLKHGVRSELLTLLHFKGIGRVRARKLFFAGIETISDVKQKDIEILQTLVGKKLAQSLHEQAGNTIEKKELEKEREEEKQQVAVQTTLGGFK
jgi:helicase